MYISGNHAIIRSYNQQSIVTPDIYPSEASIFITQQWLEMSSQGLPRIIEETKLFVYL
jgi:hypothetical protein